MAQRARLSDVATLAGVSIATVSRALSNPAVVRPDTLEKIRSAIVALRYVPDGSARALASGRTRTVGAIVPTLDNSIFALAVQGLQTTLADAGYQLLIAAHEYNPAAELALARALVERSIDALILVGADHTQQTRDLVQMHGIPLLITWAISPDYPSVGFDNRLIGELAARHLIELGHTRFGIVSGYFRHNDRARERAAGFRQALRKAKLPLPDANIIEQPFGYEGGRAGLRVLMQMRPRPTAIFCGNDVLALGCLFEALSMKLDVPGDVSIVGCDNLPISSQVSPGLTTVLLPVYDLGKQAATALLSWFTRQEPPADSCLPVELVVRGTSGPCPPA